jgi:hypothetical protein
VIVPLSGSTSIFAKMLSLFAISSNTGPEGSQIYHTLRPVGEREPDYSILQDFDFCYIHP